MAAVPHAGGVVTVPASGAHYSQAESAGNRPLPRNADEPARVNLDPGKLDPGELETRQTSPLRAGPKTGNAQLRHSCERLRLGEQNSLSEQRLYAGGPDSGGKRTELRGGVHLG